MGRAQDGTSYKAQEKVLCKNVNTGLTHVITLINIDKITAVQTI